MDAKLGQLQPKQTGEKSICKIRRRGSQLQFQVFYILKQYNRQRQDNPYLVQHAPSSSTSQHDACRRSLLLWRGASLKMARGALVIMLSSNIFNGRRWQVLLVLSLLLPCLLCAPAEPCNCLNGGRCLNGRCCCSEGFIGEQCQLAAGELSGLWRSLRVGGNYSYLYYQPQEVNYYKLMFTVCMGTNPSGRPTLFYIETERNDGSLRQTPSMFETSKLVLEENSCTTFSTHYISIKRKEDQSFRRIIVGIKLMHDQDADKYLNTYFSQQPSQITMEHHIGNDSQEITIRMSYELYLRTSYYGTFMILFTALVMLLVLTTLITFLRKKYALDAEPHPLRLSPLRLTRSLRRNHTTSNSLGRPRLRLALSNLQLFMPVTHYSTEKEGVEECSICLLEYGEGEQTRVTPCGHRYHRDCFDSWWQGNMSCPICRRSLDFNQEMRQFYYHYLRNY